MKRILRWLPVIAWALVIFSLSSIPQIKVSNFFAWDFVAKKTAHVLEYSILYILVFKANGGNFLSAFLFTMLYAVSDEFHQSFVPGRQAAVYDLAFDLSGCNIAAYIIWKLKPRLTWLNQHQKSKRKKQA